MKATAFVIFFAEVLIRLDVGAVRFEEGRWKAKDVKEEIPPPRPSFPLLTLPSFSSFSLPALNIPYLHAFSSPSRASPERVRSTKTEYVEVTRRQTVHPVCYTAYEAKAPCLPYGQSDFNDYEYDNLELEAVHQSQENFVLNEVRKVIQSTPVSQVPVTEIPSQPSEDPVRGGKYLEFKIRRNGPPESSSKIEGSEFFPTVIRHPPPQQQSTEYFTKTVLITKLEKYTDRRVTATLLAVNCLPADRSIPMCQTYPNPIRETPDRRSDENVTFQGYNASAVRSKSGEEASSDNQPTELTTEDPLIGEE